MAGDSSGPDGWRCSLVSQRGSSTTAPSETVTESRHTEARQPNASPRLRPASVPEGTSESDPEEPFSPPRFVTQPEGVRHCAPRAPRRKRLGYWSPKITRRRSRGPTTACSPNTRDDTSQNPDRWRRSTTSVLTAAILVCAIGAGITAAAGTRLALQLILERLV